jgi:60 kDa SS-A/Ro ribonucleoprotein
MSYLDIESTRRTPQSRAIPGSGQVPNSAGGFAWSVDDWERLRRFLILGSEGGTYYVGQHDLTRENADAVRRCLDEDGLRVVREVVDVSTNGRAVKQDPGLFVLALAASYRAREEAQLPRGTERPTPAETVRRAALDAIPLVCRTGTTLFHFARFCEQHRGWGRGLRRAIARWYDAGAADELAYQLVKYRQRDGVMHADLARLAHLVPVSREHDALIGWAAGQRPVKNAGTRHEWTHHRRMPGPPKAAVVKGFEEAQRAGSPDVTARLVRNYGSVLPREALNPQHLNDPDVWRALLEVGMPMTALIRNLATMTRVGVLEPFSATERLVCEQITDGERLRRARVHPLSVLVALRTYALGYSERGGSAWTPVASIVDALDGAFYAAFKNVVPSGRRLLLALDVSGSMGGPSIAGLPGISPAVGAAAMALVTAATEPNHHVVGFYAGAGGVQFEGFSPYRGGTSGITPLPISPRQRLDDVVQLTAALPFGGTDCALPMLYAMRRKIEVDAFVIYTDSETWAGIPHPVQALRDYRASSGIPAKLIVVGMASNGFSIADPTDRGMLDVVGFDTAVPEVIREFVA